MSLRVVLADDHPVVVMGVRAVIESSGVGRVVAEAANPDELMAVLAATPCDVLITDFAMPGSRQVDGYSMIGLLRRQFPDLPIVLLTMMNNPATLRRVAAAGVLGLVEKGAAMEELPAAIQSAARGRPYFSASLRQKIEEAEGSTAGYGEVRLSPRETEVVRLLASGLTVTQIAERLHRSVTTISRQKGDAMRKLGITSDAELYAYAREHGLGS
ncbi:response regulator transcription factor [Vulcaniibacterium tengchongense]|uniref:LuxR family two component transcriptional regulator n=1 Tax=Vulcaniibacterium tengchongense TaxID=1273429 RepID=A0A3N4W8M9_9GAMM|nr:response regulator transcription factor [Vulcaniibacterium tengchongense]RPE81574.1 LuxR family two component transcriptional regulator [Vulcaniibacterium tengchongense]